MTRFNWKNKLNSFKSVKGFTLIELLVVIAIIGVLVTIVIVAINPVKLIQNSQDARMRSDLQEIKAAMQLYYNDCKFYPTTDEWNTIVTSSTHTWGNVDPSSCDDTTIYMKQVPLDPSTNAYPYGSTTNCDNSSTLCSDYVVGAVLHQASISDVQAVVKCSPPVTNVTLTAVSNFRVCND